MSHSTSSLQRKLMELSGNSEVTHASNLEVFLSVLKDKWLETVRSDKCLDFNHWRHRGSATGLNDIIKGLENRIDRFINLAARSFWHDQEAVAELEKMFFDSTDGRCISKEFVGTVKAGTPLYRMRKGEKYKKYQRKEIYVIGSSLSNIAGALRYNLSGQPCLYLAESLYIAWEELRRPEFHTTNFACFKPNCELKVLDLTVPNNLLSEDALFRSFVALVCCAKANDEDNHKWQYVIPNMMMRFLHQHHLRCNDSKQIVDGIRYISSRRSECSDFQFECSANSWAYVFPQRKHSGEHCPILKSKFRMTEAFSAFFYEVHRYNFRMAKKARTSYYQDTMFARLEQQLEHEEFMQCSLEID